MTAATAALATAPRAASLVRDLVAGGADVVTPKDGNLFGETDVFLEAARASVVRTQETNLGNLTADANLAAAAQGRPDGRGLDQERRRHPRLRSARSTAMTGELLPPHANPAAGKEAGDVSQLDIENSLRFNNGLSLVTLSAARSCSRCSSTASPPPAPARRPGQFPQVGGIAFSFDVAQAAGERVVDAALVVGGDAPVPIVEDGEVLDTAPDAIRVVTLSFLVDGGDGYDFDTAGDGLDRVDLASDPAALAALGDGATTFAEAGTEQDALAEYLAASFPNDGAATPGFADAETPAEEDRRIVQGAPGSGAPAPTHEIDDLIDGADNAAATGDDVNKVVLVSPPAGHQLRAGARRAALGGRCDHRRRVGHAARRRDRPRSGRRRGGGRLPDRDRQCRRRPGADCLHHASTAMSRCVEFTRRAAKLRASNL